MKPLVALISLLVLTVGTFFLWSARLPPFDGLPEPVEVSIDELTVAQDGVRVSGTAHYSVKQSLVRPARFGRRPPGISSRSSPGARPAAR
jgi:hypothetical protein